MKKSILLLSCLVLASFAYGDWLLWTVTWSEADAISSDADSARIGYVTTGSSANNGTAFANNFDTGLTAMYGETVDFSTGDTGAMMVDLSEISGSLSSYSFYVEILNENGDVLARTKSNNNTYMTYSQLKGYIATGDIPDVPSASVWHGGTFEAVPEPSSMALLALGAGLVGLRRKMRKGKKGKRA